MWEPEPSLIQKALEAIDAANAKDPCRELDSEGKEQPTEWLYGRRMSDACGLLYPQAPPALQIAVRAQHIRRWEIPREDFPVGKAGYHRWRTTLYRFHADAIGEILDQLGFEHGFIERVRFLVQKKSLKSDPHSQALEDVACLVFLKHYFVDFSSRHSDEKVIDILQKTWRKMSDHARRHAQALQIPDRAGHLMERALA